jgi:hypothetical protein
VDPLGLHKTLRQVHDRITETKNGTWRRHTCRPGQQTPSAANSVVLKEYNKYHLYNISWVKSGSLRPQESLYWLKLQESLWNPVPYFKATFSFRPFTHHRSRATFCTAPLSACIGQNRMRWHQPDWPRHQSRCCHTATTASYNLMTHCGDAAMVVPCVNDVMVGWSTAQKLHVFTQ